MGNKCDHTWIETVPPELCIDCGAVNEDTVLPWLRRIKAEAVREWADHVESRLDEVFGFWGNAHQGRCIVKNAREYADKLDRGDT